MEIGGENYLMQEAAGGSSNAAVTSKIETSPNPIHKFFNPFSEKIVNDVAEKKLPNKEGIATVIGEIDRQAMENFSIFHSQKFPGVNISYSTLRVTSDLIEKLGSESEEQTEASETENPSQAKNEKWFMFGTFGLPPTGNAYITYDLAIDRYFRLIPKVARAMKEGRTPPTAEVVMLGSGTGDGEKITKEFLNALDAKGMAAKGELYAELLAALSPKEEEIENTHIALQGVSHGTVVIDNTLPLLPDYIRNHSQQLLDNPAGTHKKFQLHRIGQLLAGFAGEGFIRSKLDPLMKTSKPSENIFRDQLYAKHHLEEDSPEELKLKRGLATKTGLGLIKGSPLDTDDNRYYIRKAIGDPLTTGPKRIMGAITQGGHLITTYSQERRARLQQEYEALDAQDPKNAEKVKELQGKLAHYDKNPPEKAKRAIIAHDKGRSIETSFQGTHFFIYKNYDRWNQIVEYCKKTDKPTPSTEAKSEAA